MDLRGSLEEAGRELEKITNSLSFELQKWFSSQNWLDFYLPVSSILLQLALSSSKQCSHACDN